MLVLSRKMFDGISFKVGNRTIMKLKVVQCGGNTVKLGFEAPDEIEILRDELLDDATDTPAGVAGNPRRAA